MPACARRLHVARVRGHEWPPRCARSAAAMASSAAARASPLACASPALAPASPARAATACRTHASHAPHCPIGGADRAARAFPPYSRALLEHDQLVAVDDGALGQGCEQPVAPAAPRACARMASAASSLANAALPRANRWPAASLMSTMSPASKRPSTEDTPTDRSELPRRTSASLAPSSTVMRAARGVAERYPQLLRGDLVGLLGGHEQRAHVLARRRVAPRRPRRARGRRPWGCRRP